MIWIFNTTLVPCLRSSLLRVGGIIYAEENWREDNGFAFPYVMNAQLTLTLAQWKKEENPSDVNRDLG